MRCKGRLNNSPLPENSRKPILLLASHEFVQLLIKQSHESVQHSGIRDTPDNNKGTFLGATWTRSREEIIRKCVMCLTALSHLTICLTKEYSKILRLRMLISTLSHHCSSKPRVLKLHEMNRRRLAYVCLHAVRHELYT